VAKALVIFEGQGMMPVLNKRPLAGSHGSAKSRAKGSFGSSGFRLTSEFGKSAVFEIGTFDLAGASFETGATVTKRALSRASVNVGKKIRAFYNRFSKPLHATFFFLGGCVRAKADIYVLFCANCVKSFSSPFVMI
jgi:hypothetical protein